MDLFELFYIGKRETEQSMYIIDEYRSWSEINLSHCTINSRKLARFSHTVYDWSAWLLVHCKNNCLGTAPLGFWESDETCWQKVEITALVEVQPSINTQRKLLLWVLIDIQALWNIGGLELQVKMSNSFHKT